MMPAKDEDDLKTYAHHGRTTTSITTPGIPLQSTDNSIKRSNKENHHGNNNIQEPNVYYCSALKRTALSWSNTKFVHLLAILIVISSLLACVSTSSFKYFPLSSSSSVSSSMNANAIAAVEEIMASPSWIMVSDKYDDNSKDVVETQIDSGDYLLPSSEITTVNEPASVLLHTENKEENFDPFEPQASLPSDTTTTATLTLESNKPLEPRELSSDRTTTTFVESASAKTTTTSSNKNNDSHRPNVLLFIVDDLKPLFSAYKSPLLPARGTPNIDRLIKNGVSFMNAHAQMAICGPSRASFLTSLRPDTLRVYNLQTNTLYTNIARITKSTKKTVLTLPKLFKVAGYNVYGVGKIFHESEYALMQSMETWTVPMFSWVKLNKKPGSFDVPFRGEWIASPDVPDDALPDGQVAKIAANLLQNVLLSKNNSDTPFFLALGFYRPHVPWIVPKKYFDMLGPESDFHGAYFTETTKGLSNTRSKLARGNGCRETHIYKGGPGKLNSPGTVNSTLRKANKAYHASVLYLDAQVGHVLDALDRSSARDNTIIVFLSDHGFHLGDKGLYCKKTNYEQATKVPFIISVPQKFDSKRFPRNERSYAPVELLDLMPTLYDLAALDIDKAKYHPWQGESLVPILQNPVDGYVKQAAISQYERPFGDLKVWGYTTRTVRYRYTKWYRKSFEEMYDYLEDEFERVSIHATKTSLKNQLISKAFYGEEFAKGSKQAPFDFDERFNMQHKPPPKFA